MPARRPAHPRALALGLILPLALVGTAAAQDGTPQRRPWVDPPAKPAVPQAAGDRAAAGGADAVGGRAEAPSPRPADRAAKAAPDDALPKAASTPDAAPRRSLARRGPGTRDAQAEDGPHAHRFTATPAAAGAAPESSGRAAAARALAARYLAVVSAPGAAMVGAAPGFYAARVRFYGRPTTLAGLVAEKRSFARRWPERRYEPRAIRTACDAQTCTVRAVVDFRAASPGRGAVSSGAAELILEVAFAGPHPVIVAETGRVLRRGAQAGALAPSPGRA